MHFKLFREVDERFKVLQFLLEVENIVHDFIFLPLEFMYFRHILIFKVLIKSLFFFVEALNNLFSSDERILKSDFEVSFEHRPHLLINWSKQHLNLVPLFIEECFEVLLFFVDK